MKIKLLRKERKPCYTVLCPLCERVLEIHDFEVEAKWTLCGCLDKNGKLNKIELEEE